ncbi:Alpha/Beta hydrolase protein [Daldinia grandis]|nr:Alpha/Beta hydrolase protein [Daldinia grandis]
MPPNLHACAVSGPQYSEETSYTSYADSRGFIALFPSSIHNNYCWNVANEESLTQNGGGGSTGLANIIKWAIYTYNAGPDRVFITGSSSGCMTTNVMCATYPDIFAAVSYYSGFPAGCPAGSPGSSPEIGDPSCGKGQTTKAGAEWAKQIRSMYPGYNGTYPRTLFGTGMRMIWSYTRTWRKHWSNGRRFWTYRSLGISRIPLIPETLRWPMAMVQNYEATLLLTLDILFPSTRRSILSSLAFNRTISNNYKGSGVGNMAWSISPLGRIIGRPLMTSQLDNTNSVESTKLHLNGGVPSKRATNDGH